MKTRYQGNEERAVFRKLARDEHDRINGALHGKVPLPFGRSGTSAFRQGYRHQIYFLNTGNRKPMPDYQSIVLRHAYRSGRMAAINDVDNILTN